MNLSLETVLAQQQILISTDIRNSVVGGKASQYPGKKNVMFLYCLICKYHPMPCQVALCLGISASQAGFYFNIWHMLCKRKISKLTKYSSTLFAVNFCTYPCRISSLSAPSSGCPDSGLSQKSYVLGCCMA